MEIQFRGGIVKKRNAEQSITPTVASFTNLTARKNYFPPWAKFKRVLKRAES